MTASLEQPASPPTWFWTYSFGVPSDAEDAPVSLRTAAPGDCCFSDRSIKRHFRYTLRPRSAELPPTMHSPDPIRKTPLWSHASSTLQPWLLSPLDAEQQQHWWEMTINVVVICRKSMASCSTTGITKPTPVLYIECTQCCVYFPRDEISSVNAPPSKYSTNYKTL